MTHSLLLQSAKTSRPEGLFSCFETAIRRLLGIHNVEDSNDEERKLEDALLRFGFKRDEIISTVFPVLRHVLKITWQIKGSTLNSFKEEQRFRNS